jgi:hypothetical protein
MVGLWCGLMILYTYHSERYEVVFEEDAVHYSKACVQAAAVHDP